MLSEQMALMRERTRSGYFRQQRSNEVNFDAALAACRQCLNNYETMAEFFCRIIDLEVPILFPGERLHFTRFIGKTHSQTRLARWLALAHGKPLA